MSIKRLFLTLASVLLVMVSVINPALADSPKVVIQSNLSSPIILENSQDKNYLKISLTGFDLKSSQRSPINLALVIDRSGSMSGDRIERAREAAILAINMLNEEDILSVVAYDTNVEVIIPPSHVKNKNELIRKIHQIQARGTTALFAGTSKGIEQVAKNLNKEQVNRVILLSDGQANVGPSSVRELSELARIAARKGIAITTIGLGNDYNEDLMTAIAGYSDGNHAFVANSADLEKAFAKEFNDVMSVVAQDVVVTIRTAAGVKPVRLLGRDGDISGDTINVRLNQLYANQEKYVMLEVVPPKGNHDQTKPLASVMVSYDNLSTRQQDRQTTDVDIRYTNSAEEVKQAIVEEVLVDSEIQIAAIANEEALQLIEQGRNREAQGIFQSNARRLNSLSVSSAPALARAQESASQQMALADTVESEKAEVARKVVAEQNFSVQNQQQ